MKSLHRTVSKLSAVACLGLAALGAQAFELRGFRGVSWGEAAEALGAATPVHSLGDVTCYRRERENLVFGDSALSDVRYCFQQDSMVMVILDAAVDQKALVKEFQRTYGRPTARVGQTASWGGLASSTQAELSATSPSASRLAIYSNKIDAPLAKRIQKLNPGDVACETATAL
ncbi:MAG: hypothetical protein H7Z15_04695 [Rhizobacter sp.]|nr:hypothetical protein [Rhizobacter sp.]